jgi:uncharacterized protein with HEPN domain
VKDPRVYLAHILESLLKIERFTRQGKEAFLKQDMIQDAVIRNFEIMGEAAKRVPQSYRDEHPEIPWRLMAAFRDVLIHGYEEVTLQQVWSIIDNELPQLKTAIQAVIPSLEELERELSGDS